MIYFITQMVVLSFQPLYSCSKTLIPMNRFLQGRPKLAQLSSIKSGTEPVSPVVHFLSCFFGSDVLYHRSKLMSPPEGSARLRDTRLRLTGQALHIWPHRGRLTHCWGCNLTNVPSNRWLTKRIHRPRMVAGGLGSGRSSIRVDHLETSELTPNRIFICEM